MRTRWSNRMIQSLLVWTLWVWTLWWLLLGVPAALAQTLQHTLQVRLDPPTGSLEAVDRISVPHAWSESLVFRLHGGLRPRLRGEGAALKQIEGPSDELAAVPIETYRVSLEPGVREFTVSYGGELRHPVRQRGEEYGRSFSTSPGLVGSDGVFLAGGSYWYPTFEAAPRLSFDLGVNLPEEWRSVSQGERLERRQQAGRVQERWRESTPQEEIYLVASRFNEYSRPGAVAEAVVFLREPDRALAERYLEPTGRYLQMYDRLVGDYPYTKFALVENFWETGYGMPSFTLLGPQVIRLPFIPYTSYPHEILHNWWGNGVYVDFSAGNWAEGLTSYLADHLLKEQRGEGAEYRRDTLQKYADYVEARQDLPLTDFRGRHSAVTEAVGYGKTLMVFHMLRGLLGDQAFVAGLQRFYADNAFQFAAWSDLEAAFDAVSTRPLQEFFEQWVTRPGAPALRLRDAAVEESASGFHLRAVVAQTQDGAPYRLQVPVSIQLEGATSPILHHVTMSGREQRFALELPARPLRISVDPSFDLFRRLHRQEVPPAISQAFGGNQVLMVLPSAAPTPLREAYAALAKSWQQGGAKTVEARWDDALDELPDDRVIWLLGWENRFRPVVHDALAGYEFQSTADSVTLAGTTLTRTAHSAVVVARHPADPEKALAWAASDSVAALPGLARKLPHYGKYSYLGFSGDAPDNTLKGQWPVIASPLSVTLVNDTVPTLAPEPSAPLAELPPAFSAERMIAHVRHLADPALGGRGLGSPGLDEAADYIVAQLRQAGLQPGSDEGGYLEVWATRSGDPERLMTLRNVVAVIPGRDADQTPKRVVVGAHYDHLGLGWPAVRAGNAGEVHPGADDNASGIAVLLELARVLASGPPPARSVLFVAFTGEEAARLGSRQFVDVTAADIVGMLNLDTVGRLGSGPLYVLGSSSAREWPYILRGAGYVTGVPVKLVPEPLDASDQVSFIEAGIPAVQLFSGAHADYHRPSDTADKIDGQGLVKVAAVAREVIAHLASSDARLTKTAAIPQARAPKETPRRVALGTVPDFAYAGNGVRLAGVNPGSPAKDAGLREGDVVVAVNSNAVDSLSRYAEILRQLAPGDAVTIQFLRGGERREVQTRTVRR